MKPGTFTYHRPETVDEAVDLLGELDDVSVLAGGQSLVPLMNMRLARPAALVDINKVRELDQIIVSGDRLSLGATVRLATLETDGRVADALPVLATATSFVAHPQIRVRSTLGGTLCHADPAAEIPAVAVALGADLHFRSRRGERTVAAGDFFEAMFITAKEADELLVRVDFPIREGMTFLYDEVASRRHGDFPYVGLCLGVRLEDGRVAEVRAAAAGVGARPVRLDALERVMVGRPLVEVIEEAAAAAAGEVDPSSDHHASAAFRRGLLRTLVRRLSSEFLESAA